MPTFITETSRLVGEVQPLYWLLYGTMLVLFWPYLTIHFITKAMPIRSMNMAGVVQKTGKQYSIAHLTGYSCFKSHE